MDATEPADGSVRGKAEGLRQTESSPPAAVPETPDRAPVRSSLSGVHPVGTTTSGGLVQRCRQRRRTLDLRRIHSLIRRASAIFGKRDDSALEPISSEEHDRDRLLAAQAEAALVRRSAAHHAGHRSAVRRERKTGMSGRRCSTGVRMTDPRERFAEDEAN